MPSKTYIIAEIGINHNGKLKNIFKLINLANRAGACAVKFQLYLPETLSRKKGKRKFKLFKKHKNESLFQMWKRLAIKDIWLKKIEKHCQKNKIDLGFSVFDEISLKKLDNIKYKFLKIASGDIDDLYLINAISKKKSKDIILSTGMANIEEIKEATKILKKNKLKLLHCVSLYPTSVKNTNLARMFSLKKYCKNIGFSDHTIGINASIKAINLGAKIIEKHFTYDNFADGPDHILSANFNQLKNICDYNNDHKKYMGTGKINPINKEISMKKFARKSIFAKENINRDERFTIKNLEKRRPGHGLSVRFFGKLLNQKSNKKYLKGETIKV